MSDSTLSIIIPLYKEGARLRKNIEEIRRHALIAMDDKPETLDLVLIDDGSTDNTWEEIVRLCEDYPEVSGVKFSRNFGKEAAISAGLERAKGHAVVVIDGDLQHPPEIIPEMVRLWKEDGYEVVNAVKADRGKEGMGHIFGAALFNRLMTSVSGLDFRGACDFKLLDRKVVDAYLQLRERITFYRGLVAWLGFRHTDVSIHIQPRENGQSSWSLLRLLRLATTGLTAFSTLALHGITFMGLFVLAFSVALGIRTFYLWSSGQAIEGFATVILVQLFIGSIIMVGLGILGEYLSTIYLEIKNRPRYVVSETAGPKSS